MTVDFAFKDAPGFRAATVAWKGPWNEARIRREFEGLETWLKSRKVRTGAWFFLERGEGAWTVAIEAKGKVKGAGRVRVRTFARSRVAYVQFDPDQVSPRVVYHGLSDWLRWRKKDHSIRSVTRSREVYRANPWKVPAAWAATEVQFLVRK